MTNSGQKLRGIILHDLEMVYWPVPKVACTTLKNYFAVQQGVKPKSIKDPMSIHGRDLFFHTDEVIDKYFNFAYVRNPFDRLLSLYNQKIVGTVDRKVFPNPLYHSNMSFENFIYRVQEDLFDNMGDRHYIPQSELLPMKVHCYKSERDFFLKLLKPLNKSSRVDHWTPELKKIVYNIYKADFIRFGYHYNEYHSE